MELLKSKILTLPKVYYIQDRDKIKDLPIGVPFIYGDSSMKKHIIRILEYEVLYQQALKSGYPFNFKKILKDNGFKDIIPHRYSKPTYMDYKTSGDLSDDEEWEIDDTKELDLNGTALKRYVRDSEVYVNIQKLKELNVFPVWLNDIEEAVHTNIHNFATFNENMYNKKLEGMYGGLELRSPAKNLIIIDISGSIPKGVSSTCLAMSKNLAEAFYADLLITGTISTLYPYEDIKNLNIDNIYEVNGMGNEQSYFKKLVTSDSRKYNTVIAFGDNHHPGYAWDNDDRYISDKDGQELCQWEAKKLISFHTTSQYEIAGYARWFKPDHTQKVKDWVKYL